MNFLKKLFGKKEAPREFTQEEFEQYDQAKTDSLEQILGKMHGMVGHAIIPFQIGGAVDMYYFPNHIQGTGFATMELLELDGSGPKPNRHGTYELVAFTRNPIAADEDKENPFHKIERRFCDIFTTIGFYSKQAKLNPGETSEIPQKDGENICLLFDKYPHQDLLINGKKHHLLLCMELFRSEMEYARENGSARLLEILKEKDIYPYSDLNRDPVV